MRVRILFMQHAGTLGGSCISLLNTVRGLDDTRFEVVVALLRPSDTLIEFYRRHRVNVIAWPGILTFEHSTAAWVDVRRPRSWAGAAASLSRFKRTRERTEALIRHVRPDITHLNSVVLSPSAYALRRAGERFVWHVREAPPPGELARTRLLGRALSDWPNAAIFLSDVERHLWTDGNVARCHVVPNFVDAARYNRGVDAVLLRAKYAIPEASPVLCYVGGAAPIKGPWTLLRALEKVAPEIPDLICLMPGFALDGGGGLQNRFARWLLPKVGGATNAQRLEASLGRAPLRNICRPVPFADNVEEYIAMSDALVFPATRDHFARPIVEAALLKRPAIASRLPILEQLVCDEETGLLVEPEDPNDLAQAIIRLLRDRVWCGKLGHIAAERARDRYDQGKNIRAIENIYDEILSDKRQSKLRDFNHEPF